VFWSKTFNVTYIEWYVHIPKITQPYVAMDGKYFIDNVCIYGAIQVVTPPHILIYMCLHGFPINNIISLSLVSRVSRHFTSIAILFLAASCTHTTNLMTPCGLGWQIFCQNSFGYNMISKRSSMLVLSTGALCGGRIWFASTG